MASPIPPRQFGTLTNAQQFFYCKLLRPYEANLQERIEEAAQNKELSLKDPSHRMKLLAKKVLCEASNDLKKEFRAKCVEEFANSDFPEMVEEADETIDIMINKNGQIYADRITEILQNRLSILQGDLPNDKNNDEV